jgi:2,5-diketo-D-gluconate reductase A
MLQPQQVQPHAPTGNGAEIPLVRLSDGMVIPQIGFGVWQVPNEQATAAVREAIKAGYRSVDTAQGYDNEEGVGIAIQQSDVPRNDLFVTSKIRTKSMGYDEARRGIEESLRKLGLSYLDMFLIHWPTPAHDRYVDTWRAFIAAQREGLIRSVGVSNFTVPYLERIIGETGVVPVVNQVETHPLYQERQLSDFHRRNKIQLEAYSPLGTGSVLKNDTIGRIATKHSKSPAQVVLRWHLMSGHIAIPKSVHPERIRENLDLFDFTLDPYDLNEIDNLDDPNGKTGSKPEEFNDLY